MTPYTHQLEVLEVLKNNTKGKIILPNKDVIEFKEAIIFAFLGVLYLEKQTNCISSVTGASKNVIGGVYHIPN
jgi:anhydro-N-acetylmuramic acid kinase